MKTIPDYERLLREASGNTEMEPEQEPDSSKIETAVIVGIVVAVALLTCLLSVFGFILVVRAFL